eukprot:1456263-Pyramimonas_sp.AAC.1
MESCRDPILTVWDPVQIRYKLYGIPYRSDTNCMGSYTDPIQTVWDPIEIRYRLYGAYTDPIHTV